MNKTRFEQKDETKRFMLLVPIYPAEASIRKLSASIGKTTTYVERILQSLPSDYPIAERDSEHGCLLCFATIEDKRKAIGNAYVV